MAVCQAEQLLEKLQKEIAEQKKAEAELEKLSHTEDHVHFLQVKPEQHRLTCKADFPIFTAVTCTSYVLAELSVAPRSSCAVSLASSNH